MIFKVHTPIYPDKSCDFPKSNRYQVVLQTVEGRDYKSFGHVNWEAGLQTHLNDFARA